MNGQRLGIAGVGLIGGSIGLRARAAGARVHGFDRDGRSLGRALERGAIDAVEPDLLRLAAQSDTLVIALPLEATIEALDTLTGIAGPRLILDVASVKTPLVRFATAIPAFVGSHPMAGRERGGIDAAQAQLFEGATWAHVPHAQADTVARVRAFITAMGARPLEVDARRHDAIVALTSHLPQALSVALAAEVSAALTDEPDVTELCGPGMMSMLRLARSPAALWVPIVSANAGSLAQRLRSVAAALVTAAEGLDRGDSGPLMSYFESARIATDALEKRFPSNSRS